MAGKWSNAIENGKSGSSAIIDVGVWMERAVLDVCVLAMTSSMRGLRANDELISKGPVPWLSSTTSAP